MRVSRATWCPRIGPNLSNAACRLRSTQEPVSEPDAPPKCTISAQAESRDCGPASQIWISAAWNHRQYLRNENWHLTWGAGVMNFSVCFRVSVRLGAVLRHVKLLRCSPKMVSPSSFESFQVLYEYMLAVCNECSSNECLCCWSVSMLRLTSFRLEWWWIMDVWTSLNQHRSPLLLCIYIYFSFHGPYSQNRLLSPMEWS